MGYRTIAAILQNADDTARVLDCTIPLASHWGSHVVGVHCEPIPLSYATSVGYPDAALISAKSEENAKRTEELLAVFRSRVEAAGVAGEWRGSESFSGDGAVSDLPAIRSVDLIVAAQRDPEAASASNADVEALLYESGRPVLLVPYAGPVLMGLPKHVLVAWNGSKEAARATFDALPFIKQAETVEVLTIDAEENGSRSEDIRDVLQRHGAKVSLSSESSEGSAIGEMLESRIADNGADLLVMGAYGDSRLKEWLFGGTTRTVLKSMPTLTLLSR